MIKKIKISLLFMFLLFVVGVNNTYAIDLTFSTDSNIVINGRSYVIQAGSTATSISVDTNTITVVVPISSVFILKSSTRDALNNDLGIPQICDSVQSSINVSGPNTVTITPSATPCVSVAASSGLASTSSSGVSSGTSNNITSSNNTAVNARTIDTTSSASLVSKIPATPDTIDPSKTKPFFPLVLKIQNPKYNFGNTTLKNGSTGEAVKELQRFLNDQMNLGVKVDGKLGPKTITIIKKWQKESGLKADGLVGAKTKILMNSLAK